MRHEAYGRRSVAQRTQEVWRGGALMFQAHRLELALGSAFCSDEGRAAQGTGRNIDSDLQEPPQIYGSSVVPMRYRSHSRAAPRPSLIAQTTKL